MDTSPTVAELLASFSTSTKRITLRRKQLNEIPSQVLRLVQLLEIRMDFNNIIEVSKAFGELTQLERIDLSFNPIERLPDSIGQLKKLTHLDLSNCRLKQLPDSFKHCENVEFIDLSNNALETFPTALLHLTRLKRLHLDENQIRSIPDDINRLVHLETIYLHKNPLTTLPKALLKLQQVQIFTFDSTHFKAFPEVILYLGKLLPPTFAYCFGVDRYLPVQNQTEKHVRSMRLSFLRLVHQFDKKALDITTRKNLFTIFQGKQEQLAQVPLPYFWQALLFQNTVLNSRARHFLTQNYAAHPLSKSSEIALIGKCTLMSKTKLKKELKQKDIKYTLQIQPSSTHILLNRQTVAVYDKAPPQAVFVTEQQLKQFLDSLGGGYLSNADENNPITQHLASLLLSSDETNVALALEMMQGGGFPKSLLNELFIVAKLGLSPAIRKAAMKFLSLQVSSKSQPYIRRRFPLKGENRLISKNLLYYSLYCPELDWGKIASYLFQYHSLDVVYFLKHSTVAEQQLFIKENFIFNHQIKINEIRDFSTLPKLLHQYKATTHLNLNNNGFRKIPDALDAFPQLTRLDLGKNTLRAVNQNITKAPQLTHLDLSNNYLEKIPLLLGKLKHLKWLNLSKNSFSAVNIKKSGFTKAEIVKRTLQKELPNCEILI